MEKDTSVMAAERVEEFRRGAPRKLSVSLEFDSCAFRISDSDEASDFVVRV
jgi:hypothetical protein